MVMKLCICFGICLSSKWFHLRLTFFSFLKSWADNGSTNPYSCPLFYEKGWHASCHSISNMHVVVNPGLPGKPPQPRGVSYLISNRHKTPHEELERRHSFSPLLMSMSEAFSSSVILQQNSVTQKAPVVKPGLWPWISDLQRSRIPA